MLAKSHPHATRPLEETPTHEAWLEHIHNMGMRKHSPKKLKFQVKSEMKFHFAISLKLCIHLAFAQGSCLQVKNDSFRGREIFLHETLIESRSPLYDGYDKAFLPGAAWS